MHDHCPNGSASGAEAAAAREKAALELARKHVEAEPGLTRVILFSGGHGSAAPTTEPIKLVAINSTTVAAGVMPLHFGPLPESGVALPSIIIEVTPEEYQRIEAHELTLPEGWETPKELLVR